MAPQGLRRSCFMAADLGLGLVTDFKMKRRLRTAAVQGGRAQNVETVQCSNNVISASSALPFLPDKPDYRTGNWDHNRHAFQHPRVGHFGHRRQRTPDTARSLEVVASAGRCELK